MKTQQRWAICLRRDAKYVEGFAHKLWWVEWDAVGDRGGFYGGPTNNAKLYQSEQDARNQAVVLAMVVGEGDIEVVEVSWQLIRDGCLE